MCGGYFILKCYVFGVYSLMLTVYIKDVLCICVNGCLTTCCLVWVKVLKCVCEYVYEMIFVCVLMIVCSVIEEYMCV